MINVFNEQYNGGLLPDITLWALCDYIIGEPFNKISFLSLQPITFPSKPFDMLRGFRCVHIINCLKKNLNAPRPSEHPPVRGEKCQNV